VSVAGSGPLAGVRVVELASEFGAFTGKLLAGLGADVILVEPREGHPTRWYPPFVADRPGIEASLWWAHYNTGKSGVTLDLESAADRALLARLVETADAVLEGDTPRSLHPRGLDWDDVRANCPRLIWISVTSFGRDNPRSLEPITDLTSLAGSGPVWSCGYDDHMLPPVRGGGNQAAQIAGVWAANAAMIAILARSRTHRGQLVDVSMHAAGNVTTEGATTRWLVARETVQRQTGRHAWPVPTAPTLIQAGDGRYVSTGVPPRTGTGCAAVAEWLDELGLLDTFPDKIFLEIGREMESIPLPEHTDDPVAHAVVAAMRAALTMIAARLDAKAYFVDAQRRGLASAAVLAPEEALTDEHFAARGFPETVTDGPSTRPAVYPGAPFRSNVSSWQTKRAPRLGEHTDTLGVLAEAAGA
jgi:crotonobetainyl-CoA:carnitine CoA-transferase CaiB-like acyl-CoA transferase